MRAFLRGEYRVTQRAAWAVGICAERNPALIRPYLGKMISRMLEPGVHPAVQRNVVRLLQDVEIPGPLLGKVASSCFDLLFSADAPVAVKVFSMSVLARIALKRPDLCRELQLAINQQIPFATAGFRSRARRVLRSLGIPEHTIGPGPGQTEVDFPELY
jgi:hypothetical protein